MEETIEIPSECPKCREDSHLEINWSKMDYGKALNRAFGKYTTESIECEYCKHIYKLKVSFDLEAEEKETAL